MKKNLSSKILEFNESPTLALTAHAMQLKREGIDVISLTAGEPDFPTPLHIKQEAVRALEENFTHYTPNNGIPELREAISQKFLRENDLRFSPEDIVVTTGAKAALYMSLQALCSAGDEVIIQSPFYVSYPEMVKLAGGVPVILPSTCQSGFRITADQLAKAVTPRTKAFILCSPSNPTGIVYTSDELEAFAKVAFETGIFIVTDEIYEKILYDGARHFSIGAFDNIRDQVVTINGASKAFAMTGWRIGYLGARRDIARAVAKVQSQVTGNANSIAQRATVAALTGPVDEQIRMVNEFKRRRDYLTGAFSSIPDVHFVIPQGAFYLFVCVGKYFSREIDGVQVNNSVKLCSYFLEHHRVACVPGSAFGNDRCIRLSFTSSMETLQTAMTRLTEGFRTLRG
jgi:aspartate aminotransferase